METSIRKNIITLLIIFLPILLNSANIKWITDNGPVGKYEKFKITFNLDHDYENPFDPDEIDVSVLFTSPTGVTKSVKGFYYQEYERSGDFNTQTLIPVGLPVWKARFAPDEIGTWSYIITATDSYGTTSLSQYQFITNSSLNKGFVKISSNDPDYFAFDNGEPYFPLGENMAWSNEGRTYNYDAWVNELSSNGGNFIRVWQAPWHTEIEWDWLYNADTKLPGNYINRMGQAWELDYIFELCRQKNVYIMLCLINHGKFSSEINSNWDTNPYNIIANPYKGFLSRPEQIWTNSQAKEYIKRNWRYLISRYANYTSLFAWEIFNEMEWVDSYSNSIAVSAAFHQEMSDYLKTNDPYKHLVTTSYAHALNWPDDIWTAGMQIVQEHNYGGIDTSRIVENIVRTMKGRNPGKPFFMGEMGIGTEGGSENIIDPTGIFIHNTNWTSLTSKAAGGGFPWWYDNYIHPLNLYFRWQGIANFLRNENIDKMNYQSVSFSVSTSVKADLIITPGNTSWGVIAPENYFVLGQDGSIIPPEVNLTSYLYSSINNSQYRNPPTFNVNMINPGKFKVFIGDIPTWTPQIRMTIQIDGNPTSINNITVSANTVYEIDIPSGNHNIFVDNTGLDWFQVISYSVTNYTPALMANALKSPNKILGRIQSKFFNFIATQTPVIYDGILHLRNLDTDGIWVYEWWDTVQGTKTGDGTINISSGNADLSLPGISTDIAFKIFWTGGIPTNTPENTKTPTLTPTPTATIDNHGDTALYNFETGTVMGWNTSKGFQINTDEFFYAGLRCVSLTASVNAGEEIFYYIPNRDLIKLNNIYTFHIHIPSYATGIIAKLYIQDNTWTWFDGGETPLLPGQWNNLSWDISSLSFNNTCKRTGIYLYFQNSFSGTIYIDSINFKLAETITPTATSTPTIIQQIKIFNDLSKFYIYPTLIKKDTKEIIFYNLTKKNMIRIYTLDGALVKTIKADTNNGVYLWPIPTELATGIYIYVVYDINNNIVKGKFAIVK